jgi:transcriptional regulator with XRE-family HTH domain
MSILSENIVMLRNHTGLTGKKFAEKFNIGLNALQSYEQARVKNPAPLFLEALSEHFGVNIKQLFKERLTASQLTPGGKPSDYSIVHVKLEAAEQRIKDLEYTIKLQKQLLEKRR